MILPRPNPAEWLRKVAESGKPRHLWRAARAVSLNSDQSRNLGLRRRPPGLLHSSDSWPTSGRYARYSTRNIIMSKTTPAIPAPADFTEPEIATSPKMGAGKTRRKKVPRPVDFLTLTRSFRCQFDDCVGSYKNDFDRGTAFVKSYEALPDEEKNFDLFKEVKRAAESLYKAEDVLARAAQAKAYLAGEFVRVLDDLESVFAKRPRGWRRAKVKPVDTDVSNNADGEADDGDGEGEE